MEKAKYVYEKLIKYKAMRPLQALSILSKELRRRRTDMIPYEDAIDIIRGTLGITQEDARYTIIIYKTGSTKLCKNW